MKYETSKQAWIKRLVLFVTLLGVTARFIDAWHPTDARCTSCWRESDLTQIARSFYRNEGSFLYPRVDWREDTPGYVEMELPVLSWLGAQTYHVVGYHEQILRLWSSLFSAGSMVIFAVLAWRLIEPAGALLATAVFAGNGLLITTSSAIQPESAMIFFIVASMLAIERWIATDRMASFLLGCLLVGIAACCKGSAAYLGLILMYFVLKKQGPFGAIRNPMAWAGAVLAGGLPLIWYSWAHHFYLETGLSLGLSDETHRISWDAATDSTLYATLVHIELIDVFVGGGLVFAVASCVLDWRKSQMAIVWYASACLFYLLSLDTSGDFWAYYYHMLSVPPAALLIGQGFLSVRRFVSSRSIRKQRLALAAITVLAALVVIGGTLRAAQFVQQKGSPQMREIHDSVKELASVVPVDGRIVIRGSTKFDEHGHPAAYHVSMPFTWMDRKGFVYAAEDAVPATIERIARRGGNYWLINESELNGDFGRKLQEFELLAKDRKLRLYYVPIHGPF
jgi:Dolichyl-phosphate-mannose-protein mannosyltransferase